MILFKKRFSERSGENTIFPLYQKRKSNLPIIEKQRALPVKGKVYFAQRPSVADVGRV